MIILLHLNVKTMLTYLLQAAATWRMYTMCTNLSSAAQTCIHNPDQPSIIRAETAEHKDHSQTLLYCTHGLLVILSILSSQQH